MGGKTSNESKARYNAKVYDKISIIVHKGRKAEIKAAADRECQSLNAWIADAVAAKLGKK